MQYSKNSPDEILKTISAKSMHLTLMEHENCVAVLKETITSGNS